MRSDAEIKEDVISHLTLHAGINESQIGVNVHEGTVELKGRVDDPEVRTRASETIKHIAGVLDIVNEIHIGPADQHRR